MVINHLLNGMILQVPPLFANGHGISAFIFFTQQNATLQKIQRISSSNKKQGEEKHLFQKVI